MTRALTLDERDRMAALSDLLGRTGVQQVQVRFSDDDAPIIWMAAGFWLTGRKVAAGFGPIEALSALAEAAIDGGQCVHCGRITALLDDPAEEWPAEYELQPCLYQYDPELKTYRRSCEGDQ